MNQYRHIDRAHLQFDFVIHADGITPLAQEAIAMGATVHTCPSFRAHSAFSYCRWWHRFFAAHPEYRIVHSHVRSTAAIVLFIAKKFRCKTIAHSHNTSSGSGVLAWVKDCLQYPIRHVADYFMGCSQEAGEWLFGKKICASARYFNIRNAIDVQQYAYDEHIASTTRKKLGFKDDDFIIGHVGRFTQQKNHVFLLNLFRELHKRDERFKLLLIGEGELKEKIEILIRKYGLNHAVTLTGRRSDVNHLMMGMDLFLFPSLFEGLGIVLIEAQATGCSCLASDAIPKAACLSPLVERLSLRLPISSWVENIQARRKTRQRGMQQLITEAGYDIHESAAWIERFYSNVEKGTLL